MWVREKAITNTRNLFQGQATRSTSPPHRVKDFNYPLRIFHKWATIIYTRSEVYNSNLQSSTHEVTRSQWSLQALGDHKDHKPSLYNFLGYRTRNETQGVYVRENSVEMNRLESLKLVKIDLKLRDFETWKLEIFFLE